MENLRFRLFPTGIDNENYYKNILRNENNTDLQQIEIEPKTLETSNTFNSGSYQVENKKVFLLIFKKHQ